MVSMRFSNPPPPSLSLSCLCAVLKYLGFATDHSELVRENDPDECIRMSSLRDLLRSNEAWLKNKSGKALNALDNPRWSMEGADIPLSLRTCLRAYFHTYRTESNKVPFPIPKMMWSLAATAGSFHYWHIDTSGMATFIYIVAGVKIWFVAKPRGTNTLSSSSGHFVNIKVDEPNGDKWVIEAVVLRPGDLL